MNTALVIEKDGTLKISNIKNIDKLYSVCNYRNDTNFEVLYTWKNTLINYELYGKKKMKGSIKNNYQMPHPIDKELYYGALCVIKKMNQEIVNMTMEDWILIINKFKTNVTERNNESNETDIEINENEKDEEEDETNTLQLLMKNREKELLHEDYEEE